MRSQKKTLYLIIAALAAGLLLKAVEYIAGQTGLELRTFAQVWKGLYLWMVMPYLILFAGNALIKAGFESKYMETEEDDRFRHIRNGLRRVLFGIFFVVIFASAFFRGLLYVLSRDLVTEKELPDGYIEGTWADFLSESHTDYYVSVAGIFRKPFPGWTEEQITEIVHEKYSPEAECVELQEGNMYVFRMPDRLEKGGYIYFHVFNSYHAGSNFNFQVLLSEASRFWDGRGRNVMIRTEDEVMFEDVRDTGQPIAASEIYGSKKLFIPCGSSEEEMAACAADLTDWLQFVRDIGQFPYDSAPDAHYLLTDMILGSGEETFLFTIHPLEDFMGEDPWQERYRRMKNRIGESYEEYHAWLEEYRKRREEEERRMDMQREETDSTDVSEEEYGKRFMEVYDGRYEKECLVGDGRIRYRMVVEDAALGSRFYGLLKSTDAGETWQMSNRDPFDQQMGMGIDFIFLDKQFGFASLMHNGGDEADLYVTEDGGDSYQAVAIEGYTVTLENGYTYAPYDYPQMPYEEDGMIYMLCGQGADGDYAGGDAAGLALYRSEDRGHTFSFVEIRQQ